MDCPAPAVLFIRQLIILKTLGRRVDALAPQKFFQRFLLCCLEIHLQAELQDAWWVGGGDLAK
jgi:hypothetical protein